VAALRGVTLKIAAGDMVALAGPSGSGKSTLLNLLGLVEPVQKGHVYFEGESLAGLNASRQNAVRRFRLGFVFQQFHLIDVLTVHENVEYFLARQGLGRAERLARVEDALRVVGILDQSAKRVTELSGGQRQRVAIARALAKRPAVILADEPTASLDQHTGGSIMDVMGRLNADAGVTFVIASHDPMVLSRVRSVIRLVDGRRIDAGGEGGRC
jgi:putative ABC transport system ATP-binding protein